MSTLREVNAVIRQYTARQIKDADPSEELPRWRLMDVLRSTHGMKDLEVDIGKVNGRMKEIVDRMLQATDRLSLLAMLQESPLLEQEFSVLMEIKERLLS